MSTEPTTRSRHGRRQRQRKLFLVSFLVVVGVLAVLAVAGGVVSLSQGPRVTSVEVDPKAASEASGSRMIITTNQSLNEVTAEQITIEPAAEFTVDTSGRTIGVRFALPLADDTDYTVTIDDVTGLGSEPATTITESFSTPAIDLYVLQRGSDGDGDGDTIFRTDLAGEAAVPVFEHAHIEDFRATSNYLAISVRTDDDKPQLIVTDLAGENSQTMTLPGEGQIVSLQSADRGDLVGYVYSDAELTETSGQNSVLYTASLDEPAAEPEIVEVAGADLRVADWEFVPDTNSVLIMNFDGRLLLASSEGEGAVDLGSAVAIDGIARGSSVAVIERVEGMVAVDLTDGSEEQLVDALDPDGVLGIVTPLPGDAGTIRPFAGVDDAGRVSGTTIAVVSETGETTPIFRTDAADALLQTCVSPSGRYAAVTIAPDIVTNTYDTYFRPLPGEVETHIIDISGVTDGSLTTADALAPEVVALAGSTNSWCQASST